jgi:sensor histidine kinase YesM
LEPNHSVLSQILTNFPVFVEGILLFQIAYMTVQFILTNRASFFWYVLYLLSAIAICFSVVPGENFFQVFLEGKMYANSLLALSSLCYWFFWKSLFDIKAIDGVVNIVVNITVLLLLFLIGADILTKIFPTLQPFYFKVFELLLNVPQVTSLWLFYVTFRTRDKVLSSLLIFGALAGNLLTMVSLLGFPEGVFGLSAAADGLFWFTLSYLVETIFFSFGLAYRTQQIFEKNKDLEIRIVETKMAALRAQMNPHFIHNCLNAINRFILNHENDAATHYLTKFSRLIRDVLNHSRKEHISLADELQTIRHYLDMESLRFSDQFAYNIQVAPNVVPEQVYIPPMLIQPFVENAIYHGLLPKKGDRKVMLEIKQQRGQLIISIIDNGIGRKEAARLQSMNVLKQKALGAQITTERIDSIHELTGIHASVETTDLQDDQGTDCGTTVVLTLPI